MSRSSTDSNPFDNAAADEAQAEQPEEAGATQESRQSADPDDDNCFAEPPVITTD